MHLRFHKIILLLVCCLTIEAHSYTCREVFGRNFWENILPEDLSSFHYGTYAESMGLQTRQIKPHYGYLKGFEINIYPETQAKLIMKHEMKIEDIEKAFNMWTEGPVLATVDHIHGFKPDGAVRYEFVSRIKRASRMKKGEIWNPETSSKAVHVKVILDLREDGTLELVTAYYTHRSDFLKFRHDPKELE